MQPGLRFRVRDCFDVTKACITKHDSAIQLLRCYIQEKVPGSSLLGVIEAVDVGPIVCFVLGGLHLLPDYIERSQFDRIFLQDMKCDVLKPSEEVIEMMIDCFKESSDLFCNIVDHCNKTQERGWLRKKSTVLVKYCDNACERYRRLEKQHNKKSLTTTEKGIIKLQICLSVSSVKADCILGQAWGFSNATIAKLRLQLKQVLDKQKIRQREQGITSPFAMKSPLWKKTRPSRTPISQAFSPRRMLPLLGSARKYSRKSLFPSEPPPSPVSLDLLGGKDAHEEDNDAYDLVSSYISRGNLSPVRRELLVTQNDASIICENAPFIRADYRERQEPTSSVPGPTVSTNNGNVPEPAIVTPLEDEDSGATSGTLVSSPCINDTNGKETDTVLTNDQPTKENNHYYQIVATRASLITRRPHFFASPSNCTDRIDTENDSNNRQENLSLKYEIQRKLSEAVSLAETHSLPLQSIHSNGKRSHFGVIPHSREWKQWRSHERRHGWI